VTLHKTKGIVLRVVKYGETSVIVTIFTELFGIQSYMVNGVRTTSKKGTSKANLFQPASLLDMVVYHNDIKNIQRIKEYKWSFLYRHVFFDVIKNAVALFMVELLQKTLKQPESNPDLYYFVEDAFMHLDRAEGQVVANFPLYFALHLATFYGFQFTDNYSEEKTFLDLQEGQFVSERPVHSWYLQYPHSYAISQLLKAMQPGELNEIKLNHEIRRLLLQACQTFYALHIQDFGSMKTLPVLQEVIG